MLKGEVVFVENRGKAARVGARSEDGLMWFWTTTGPAPQRGQIVPIPLGAKPEPSRKNRTPRESPNAEASTAEVSSTKSEEVERVLKAVALKAAAQLCAGQGPQCAEDVLKVAEKFLPWLTGLKDR